MVELAVVRRALPPEGWQSTVLHSELVITPHVIERAGFAPTCESSHQFQFFHHLRCGRALVYNPPNEVLKVQFEI